MNPAVKGGKQETRVVFFAEGGYEKLVYYKGKLLHRYRDEEPTSN